ncbi:pilus assembly protein [Pseudomonas sp. R1-18]|uniref:pilus assembly protein n=1 Tax=Pseudomonas sp. R1-18 TaxID=1632772 RepID=UPI003DAA1EFE
MRIAEILRRCLKLAAGALLGFYLAAPVYAFTPSQVPLLSASAVTPNVMLMVDNSGSMNNIIWASGFNPNLARPKITYWQLYSCGRDTCQISTDIDGNGTLILSSASSYSCGNSNYTYVVRDGVSYCLLLPDPAAGEGSTRYTADYLSYLIDLTRASGNSRTKDFTVPGLIPNDFRMRVARNVSLDLVKNNSQTLRIGLAGFNAPTGTNSGPGGKISRNVLDLTAVQPTASNTTGVTAEAAKRNLDALNAAITAIRGDSNTPLAETYYEITRYFRGMAPYYNSLPTRYESPIQYRCQKNVGVVITDGLPTFDRSFPSDDPEDAADGARSLPNWDLRANDGFNLAGDGEGDTLYLDDLARFAYDIDMRKTTGTSSVDLTSKSWDTAGFPRQNMTTYTIGFTADNQMLIDAADDQHGRGKYFQTNDSAGLNAALSQALSDIYAKAGSGGGGAANSSTLQAGSRFYQTLYDPTDWRGTIRAYNLSATTGELGSIEWTTDTRITSGSPGPIFESWNTASPARINLDYNNFSASQRAVIDTGLPPGVNGANLINWSKGVSHPALRSRTRILGDIVNSPLAAALPSDKTAVDLLGDGTYTTYLSNKNSNMVNSLLVNTNDGFFNVLSAAGGERRYAYMPSTVLPALSTVASTSYGSGVHKFTVDGQISVFDTQAGAASAWRTVAYGGTGAGGKSYFAIKLFEGTNNNSISALWEVKAPEQSEPGNNFNNLGFAYSKPEVARMANGTGIVVIGNGYGSFTGRASLLVLNANTGAFITEIPTPVLNNETDNGLSSVKLRVNSQNVVQAAYAGDLKGRMWKFDMSSTAASGWKVAFNGQPLFTAPGGANQPITVQPLLIDHPLNGKLVYFGTGKVSEAADKFTSAQQAFYAIWDADGGSGSLEEGNLQAQAVNGTVTGSAATYFTSTSNPVDWTTRRGWYMPLTASTLYPGERIIYPAQTSRTRIIFTTASVNSSDPCESTGTGRLFELDSVTGSMLTYQVLDTNGDNDISTVDSIVSGQSFGSGIPVLASVVAGTGGANDNKYVPDSSGGTPSRLLEKGGSANLYQRIMWRQIQ